MRLHQVRRLATGLLAAAALFALLGAYVVSDRKLSWLLCIAAVAALAAYWAVLMKFWHCPQCGGHLPTKGHFYSVKHCPQCGKELDMNRW